VIFLDIGAREVSRLDMELKLLPFTERVDVKGSIVDFMCLQLIHSSHRATS
jgi:hypothetical protein